jgi:hypothetical protein
LPRCGANLAIDSAYQGYQLNGNKNGYQMPYDSKMIDGSGSQGETIFQNGIRTPGFITGLPICGVLTAMQNWNVKQVSITLC